MDMLIISIAVLIVVLTVLLLVHGVLSVFYRMETRRWEHPTDEEIEKNIKNEHFREFRVYPNGRKKRIHR